MRSSYDLMILVIMVLGHLISFSEENCFDHMKHFPLVFFLSVTARLHFEPTVMGEIPPQEVSF